MKKLEQKKMFVVGLKATKTRPALWIDAKETVQFSNFMKNEGIDTALRVKKLEMIVNVLLDKLFGSRITEKEALNLKKTLLKLNSIKL